MDIRHIVGLLLAALAATNTAWLILYHARGQQVEALKARLAELNQTLEKLADQAKSLDEENTRLLLQLEQARKNYEKLLDLLRQADTATKAALIEILAKLNNSITDLYIYVASHTYYTPMVKALYRPGQVADKVYEILGVPVYRPGAWQDDMKKLYNWTIKNIQYAPDHHFAALRSISYVNIEGKRYIDGFEVDITDNYIQEPVETLLRGAGDCEDMAILLSSMYSIYLHGVGDAWVLCLLAKDFNHCMSIAHIKPNATYVLADPSVGFYTTSSDLRTALDQWLSFIGVRWDDLNRAIVFNGKVFHEGTPADTINFIERLVR